MEVTFIDNNKQVKFQELKHGDTFIDPNYDDEAIFVVVRESLDVSIKPEVESEEFFGYATAINDNGLVFGYKADEKVIPVDLKIIVSMR